MDELSPADGSIFGSSEAASEGGKARAQRLSPEARRDIARRAAEARWAAEGHAPMPRAKKSGTLVVGDISFGCSVIETESEAIRAISEARFMSAMGIYRSGALSKRRSVDATGAQEPLFLAFKNLKPYIDRHLGGVHFQPFRFVDLGGSVVHGIRAEIIPKVCEVWIDANRDGVLGKSQQRVAEKADILLRGLAQLGIVAMVDLCTGYSADIQRDAYAKLLARYVSKDIQKWVRTFDPEYYQGLFRLWNVPFNPEHPDQARPQFFGHLTNNFVYARLAPLVLDELKRLNPTDESGRRRRKFFVHLTPDHGHPRLKEHLSAVVALMKAADNKEQFIRMMDRSLPKQPQHVDEFPLFAEIEEKKRKALPGAAL